MAAYNLDSTIEQYEFVRQILNIYLYGYDERPEYFGDHIRDVRSPSIVNFVTQKFMSEGPGKYIKPYNFGVIHKFLGGQLTEELQAFFPDQTVFTYDDLKKLDSIDDSDISLLVSQSNLDTDSADYFMRVFVFQTQVYQLEEENVTFEITPDGLIVHNVAIEPLSGEDNFDFITGGNGQIGNKILLEPLFDPYGLGENDTGAIKFEYTGDPYSYGDYTFDNLRNDLAGDFLNNGPRSSWGNIPTGNGSGLIEAIAEAMAEAGKYINLAKFAAQVPLFAAALNFYYDKVGRRIVYGTNGDDPHLDFYNGVPLDDLPGGQHFVAGAGNDSVFGGLGKDYLEGNAGEDILDGGSGDDIVIGGLHADTLIGSKGSDFLFGHEAVYFGGPLGAILGSGAAGEAVIASAPSEDGAVDTADYSGLFSLNPFRKTGITLEATALTATQLAAGFLLITDDGQGGQDVLHSIEIIHGTRYNDSISFAGNFSVLQLQQLLLGAGEDTLDFSAINQGPYVSGLEVNLTDNEAELQIDWAGGGITVSSVERLIGSGFDDQFTFSGDFFSYGFTELRGGDGIDTLDLSEATDSGGISFNSNRFGEFEHVHLTDSSDRVEDGGGTLLEINTGAGDDDIRVTGAAGLEIYAGAGRDLISSGGTRGARIWGNERGVANNTGESDMFLWSPGAFIMDADPTDFVSFYGYTLTGGSNFFGGGTVHDTRLWYVDYNSTDGGQLLISVDTPDVKNLTNLMVVERYDYGEHINTPLADIGLITRGDLHLRFKVWDVENGKKISIFEAVIGELVFYAQQFWTIAEGMAWHLGRDPLVLDLDGDGIETISSTQSRANFDFDDDFFAERTGWVDSDDGLLAVDRNADGVIDDISELFGGNNPDGIEQTGFAALSDFDSNLDGVVDASDADFDQLLVWRDLDDDGKGESGDADGFGNELFTLEELGISSISTGSTAFDESTGDTEGGRIIASGATLLSEGSYTRTDGSTGAVYEVIFETDTTRTIYRGNTSLASWNPAIAAGSETGTAINATGRGRSTDLAISAANDPLLSAVIAAQLSQMGVAAGEAPDLATLRDLAA